MTFKELQDNALDRLQYDYSLVTSLPRTRIKKYINEWQKRLLGDPRFSHLREGSMAITTVPGSYIYPVPMAMEKIRRVYDAVGNNPELRLGDPNWYRRDPQAQISQGTPAYYVPIGYRPLAGLPKIVGGSPLWATSNSPADVATIHMDAIRQGYYPFKASAVMQGVTPVQIGGRDDYVDVTHLALTAPAVGDVSIMDAQTGGRLLGIIPAQQYTVRYFVLHLYPVPSSAITYTVDGRWVIQDMVTDTDQSILTDSYDQVLALCACYEELLTWKKETDLAQNLMQTHITPLLTAFLDSVANPDTQVLIPEDGRARGSRSSNLGSWFPAGRW